MTPDASPARELFYLDAVSLSRLLRSRRISAHEVMGVFLERMHALNPIINAICTLRPDEDLLEAARQRDAAPVMGPLHGMPLAVKDLALTRGLRTTFGSPIYRDFIPAQDTLFVARLKAAGAIIIGKTNTPEFGAGSHTFNTVFGVTRNPYDPRRTAGGSSGGAAAALAAGLVPLADGSDLGGSLRNPAAFCNVVGFRPSIGRVPNWPAASAWDSLSTEGPMGRTVADVALLLSVMAGPDPRAPLSLDQAGDVFEQPLDRDFSNTPIAWSADLGCLPVQPEVRRVFERSLTAFAALGADLTQDHPDVEGAMDAFQILRAFEYTALEEDYRRCGDLMKDTVIWNIKKGLRLTTSELARAHRQRTLFYHRVCRFFEAYEFLLLPAAQVEPFTVDQEWVKEINGAAQPTYIDWMAICCIISLTGLPCISVPCGFTSGGLPVGIQIVGRFRCDRSVLQLARAFEALTRYHLVRPKIGS